MANNRVFGLAVPLSLADIPDKDEALLNLGLNIDDLEVIRGISESGFDGNDLQTLSNLTNPIWKTFDRYISDILTYNSTLTSSSGADFRARGNLEVFGSISASAFRYTLVDTFQSPPVLRWGDISTSRVSSWSTIGNSISYGADVKITGALGVGKLKTSVSPTERKFAAEVPTHKIRLNLNGVDRFFYVMKGIPISFKGFFRNVDLTLTYTSQPTLRPSYRVYDINSGNIVPGSIIDFENVGTQTTSTLRYRGITSTTKIIEGYINPELVTGITLRDSNIQELPKSRFNLLTTLDIQNNGLVNLPDFNFLAPALTTLIIQNNPFFNGNDLNLRFFSKKVRDNIPSTVQVLFIAGCFKGSFVQNTLDKFQALRTINVFRGFFNAFYSPGSQNPTGSVPNFRGINDGTDPDDETKKITTVAFRDQDFRVFDNGSQGGVPDTFTLTNGGSGYGTSGNFTGVISNVLLTGGSGSNATANITLNGGTVVAVDVVDPGNGYTPGNTLSAAQNFAGGSGSGFQITLPPTKEELIWTMNLKQQPNLVVLDLYANNLLTDAAFQLNCPSTLTTVRTDYTRLSIANCSNFTKLDEYNATFGLGRGTMYNPSGSEWDGTFGGSNYPITDQSGFKFANASSLRNFRPSFSDLKGYLPKFVGCTNLRSYSFYGVNGMIAGRPGKRRILSFYSSGGIAQPLGNAVPQTANPGYTPFLSVEVSDTGDNSSPSVFAKFLVTVNATGDNISDIVILNPGSGYNNTMKITIDGNDLGANGTNKDLIIDINNVEGGIESSNDYNNGTYTLNDTRLNTAVGRNARVQFDVVGGIPQNFSIENPGQDYQDDEFVTFSTADIGGTSDLKLKIFSAEKPKILYNDQFTENPNIDTVDIRVFNSSGMRGEIEPDAFSPLVETLSFLRLEFAPGAVESDFPNLDSHQALGGVRSADQGWTGPVPLFSSAFNLRNLYLSSNKFTGTFLYDNKTSLSYVDFSNNEIELISDATDLNTATKYFYFANNKLSGVLPVLDNIVRNAEYITLSSNNYDNYSGGLVGLKKIKSLDLSSNKLPTPVVDQILFDLVENYASSPRSGVLINLQGGQMGAPTPYPTIQGILSSVSAVAQPTITNGVITSLGSLSGFSPGSIPIAGTYGNVPIENASGSGGRVNVTVTSNFLESPVTTINTTPIINATGTLGEVKAIGTYTSTTLPGNFQPNYTGVISDNDPPGGGTPAQVEITVDGTGSISSVTLVNGGSGYTIQGSPRTIKIADNIFDNSNFEIPITSVTEFTNGTYTLSDISSPAGGSAASVSVTVSGGQITSSSISSPPSGEGYAITDTIDVTIPATGDYNSTGNVSYSVTGISDTYYTSLSYAVSINTGGSDYTALQNGVTTASAIAMRKTNGTNETAKLGINIDTVTSRVNKSVSTGLAAVEYLRSNGWSIQVQT